MKISGVDPKISGNQSRGSKYLRKLVESKRGSHLRISPKEYQRRWVLISLNPPGVIGDKCDTSRLTRQGLLETRVMPLITRQGILETRGHLSDIPWRDIGDKGTPLGYSQKADLRFEAGSLIQNLQNLGFRRSHSKIFEKNQKALMGGSRRQSTYKENFPNGRT